MKKILYFIMVLAAVTMIYSCQQKKSSGVCRVFGTVNNQQYEGKHVFLVPLKGPGANGRGDSTVIRNGKFEFEPDSIQLYKVMLDEKNRFDLQPLLIVAEPGDVWVRMDTVSHAGGTPQNDSLDLWKTRTEQYKLQSKLLRQLIADLDKKGERAQADVIEERAISLKDAYLDYTRRLAKDLNSGPLYDFLNGFAPKDPHEHSHGTTETTDADTHEEGSE